MGAGDPSVPSAGRAGVRGRRGSEELGEDRVVLHDALGAVFSLPAAWTDAGVLDPFVVVAAGRCPFTMAGLVGLADLIDRLRSQSVSDAAAKRITP